MLNEGQRLGDFEILDHIGHGGMGAVFKARQTSLQRIVALKTLKPFVSDDPEYVARFHQEAVAAAALNHPNLVQVYAAGEAEGIHFFAMEYIDGESAQGRLERQESEGREGRIEPLEAIAIATHVSVALEHGWRKAGLIHRDIKPDNIFLSTEGEVKLGDLGLAKSGGQSMLTQTGTAIGTPHYISPEQAEGKRDIDLRADIYSLGCTLYRLLGGRTPYVAESAMAVMLKHVSAPVPDVRDAWPECPPELAALVKKMMQKAPADRFQSHAEVGTELRRVYDILCGNSVPNAVGVAPDAATRRSGILQGAPVKKSKVSLYAGIAAGVIALVAAAFFIFKPKAESPSGASEPSEGRAPARPQSPLATIPASDGRAGARPSDATKDAPYVNALGMKFAPVPGTTVLFSIWDTRVRDYAEYARVNKVDDSWTKQQQDGVPVGREPDHPVVAVSWDDAQGFCQWLTKKESAEGKLPSGMKYRLPSDEEWSRAVGLPPEPGATPAEKSGKNNVAFPWGGEYPPKGKVGNLEDEAFHAKFPPKNGRDNPWMEGYDDGYATTSPVGNFPANEYGLYDMGGNVSQWCEDWFDASEQDRVLRGASWHHHSRGYLLSSNRAHYAPSGRQYTCGFRCVLAPATSAAPGPAAGYPQPAQWTDATAEVRKIYEGSGKLVAEGGWLRGTGAAVLCTIAQFRTFRNCILRVAFSDRVGLALRRRQTQGDPRYDAGIAMNAVHFEAVFPTTIRPIVPIFRLPASLGQGEAHEAVFAAQSDTLTLWLDGKEIATGHDASFDSGSLAILFSNDEKGVSRIRKIEYGELPDSPAPVASAATASPAWQKVPLPPAEWFLARGSSVNASGEIHAQNGLELMKPPIRNLAVRGEVRLPAQDGNTYLQLRKAGGVFRALTIYNHDARVQIGYDRGQAAFPTLGRLGYPPAFDPAVRWVSFQFALVGKTSIAAIDSLPVVAGDSEEAVEPGAFVIGGNASAGTDYRNLEFISLENLPEPQWPEFVRLGRAEIGARTSTASAAAGGWEDLLAPLTPEFVAQTGHGWRLEAGALRSPSKQYATLPVPGAFAGTSYQLRVKMRQLIAKDVFHVVLPVGDRMTGFELDGFAGKYTGLVQANGKHGKDLPGVVEGKQVKDSEWHDLEVTVRLDGATAKITTTLDGRPLYEWTGLTTALSQYPPYASTPPGGFALGTMADDWVVSEMKVKRLEPAGTQAAPSLPEVAATPKPATEVEKWFAQVDGPQQEAYQKQAGQPFEVGLADLRARYLATLDAAIAKASAASQLAEALAWRTERQAFAKAQNVATDDTGVSPGVQAMRVAFRQQLLKLDQTRLAKAKTLFAEYDAALAKYQALLTQRERLDDALLLKTKREEVARAWLVPSPLIAVDGAGRPESAKPIQATTLRRATREAPYVNSLGMKFVPVPGTKVLFSIWDTRVQDYEVFARIVKHDRQKPDFPQGPTHPAVNVSWEDAQAFCAWLTTRERKAGNLGANEFFRLPSDHEWSCAAGIGEQEDAAKEPTAKSGKIDDTFPWGTQWPPPEKAGNFASEELLPLLAAGKSTFVNSVIAGYHDGYANTSPVGYYAANQFGLFDMGGNVQQWCEDWFEKDKKNRVLRGSSWSHGERGSLLSSHRFHSTATSRYGDYGFRCVLAVSGG